MNSYQHKIAITIINYGISFITLASFPLIIIAFLAVQKGPFLIIKYIPEILTGLVTTLYFSRNRIQLTTKIKMFVSLLFLTGLYTLLLGLLDMASLWFILAIIFALFDEKKSISLMIFFAAVFFIVITGLLMMFKNPYIPIDYGFKNCQFACVAIRIINFLIIGFLVFKIRLCCSLPVGKYTSHQQPIKY